MSLLDTGNQDIIVYPEELTYDTDGNPITRPSTTGIPAKASLQPAVQSGTSARRAEQDNEGFETETNYRLRLPRSFPFQLNAQSRIEWQGGYWAVMGEARQFTGSKKTAHVEYQIRRT